MFGLLSFPTYLLLEAIGNQNIVFDGLLVQVSMIHFVHKRELLFSLSVVLFCFGF